METRCSLISSKLKKRIWLNKIEIPLPVVLVACYFIDKQGFFYLFVHTPWRHADSWLTASRASVSALDVGTSTA